MTTYRFSRPTTALLVLTVPIWGIPLSAFLGIKEYVWDDWFGLKSDVKKAFNWSIAEPLRNFTATFGLIAYLAVMITGASVAKFWREQARNRLVALFILVAIFPVAWMCILGLATVSAAATRSLDPYREMAEETVQFMEDLVLVMRTGEEV